MNFKEKTDFFLRNCENPQVYTGKEINVIKNDFDSSNINICLIFPDKYEIGMSHYGIKLLYHFLNNMEGVNAERAFLPDKNSIEVLKEIDLPLFSIENKIPIKEFDLIAFSLLSEMNFTNLLAILDLAKIPILSDKRDDNMPIISAGGISIVNPEPIADFIDFFAIGDGEVIFPDILEALKDRKKKRDRKEFLDKLQKKRGIYIPALTVLKKVKSFITPDLPDQSIKKSFVKQGDLLKAEENLIVPITNVVFDRLDVEIARGCPQNCRFCQAKSYYSPYRFRKLEDNLIAIKKGLENTGFESAALSTLSAGDYPFIEDLLNKIPAVLPSSTAISFSSLRPSTISDNLLATIAQFRKTGITIVPEAGSERLRKVINKNVTDDEIFSAVKKALKYGWQKIKLYFMIGLPTETDEDIFAIIELIEKIIEIIKEKKKRLKITISFSSFVPKPHTPFQWSKREDKEVLISRMKLIRRGLERYRFLQLDFHKIDRGVVETLVARGDRSVGNLLMGVYRRGEIFSAWDTDFNYDIWYDEMSKIDYGKYLDEISRDEPLPWDFMEINFTKEYLLKDYEKAMSEIPAVSCNETDCNTCKGCNYRFAKFKKSNIDAVKKRSKKIISDISYNKVRVFFSKSGEFKYFSHLSMSKFIERIIRKSGLIYKSTEGFRPRLKIAYLPPLPVYAEGEEEVFEFFIDAGLAEDIILDKLKNASNEFDILGVKIINEGKSLNKDIKAIEYELETVISSEDKNNILSVLRDTDEVVFGDKIYLKIDFTDRGPEQFSKIYKIIDSEKKNTKIIKRKRIVFKSF